MTRCLRCGAEFVRMTVADIHCPHCVRDLERLMAPKRPSFTPEWRRRDLSRDLTGSFR